MVGSVFGGQQGGQFEVAQVVQAEHAGSHPGDAAQLAWAGNAEAVDAVGQRKALAQAAAEPAIVGVTVENVNSNWAAVFVNLHSVDDGPATGQQLVVVGVDAVNVDGLQGEVEWVVGLLAAHDLHQELAIAGQASHQGFAQVAQGLAAIERGGLPPAFVCGLNGCVGQAVGLAGCIGHAHLQPDAAGADDVGLHHADELGCVVVVADQVAATGAEFVEV